MDEVLKFLSVPENRTVLAWLGGGLSTVAAAGWIVLKYFLDQRAKKTNGGTPKEGSTTSGTALSTVLDASVDQSTDNSVAVGSGIAFGAGSQVISSRIQIGFGLRALFLISLLVGLLLIAGAVVADRLIAPAFSFAEPMKTFAFSLSCGTEGKAPYLMEESEAVAVEQFVGFLEENQGKPVYVSVRLFKECAACSCNRQSPIPRNMEMGEHGVLFVDAVPKNERWELSPMMKEAHQLTAFGPPFSVSQAIFLPSYAQLPNNGQYSRGEYGSFLTYEGPFVATHFSGTGYLGGLLEPLSVITKDNIAQIECIRSANKQTAMQKLLKGCPP